MDVADLHGRIISQHLVADRMNQMRLAQTHAAVQEQRVVGTARIARDLNRGRASQLVGFAGHEAVEGQCLIDAALIAPEVAFIRLLDALNRRLLGRHGRGLRQCCCFFKRAVTRIEHELDVHRRLPEFRRQTGDPVRELGLHPVQLESIGRGDAKTAVLEIERRQRLDPGAELLRRQLLLQPRGAGLPEFFHSLSQ